MGLGPDPSQGMASGGGRLRQGAGPLPKGQTSPEQCGGHLGSMGQDLFQDQGLGGGDSSLREGFTAVTRSKSSQAKPGLLQEAKAKVRLRTKDRKSVV